MGKMDSLLLRSKFRGSMLGALMGDCLGSAYEGEELFTSGMRLVFQRSFDKLEGPHFKAPVMQFTDDSAMTRTVAESLIEQKGFDQKDMTKKFVKSFYKEPNRGYGAGVTTVFQKLRNNKFADILGPAREQFNGEGSLGNGGAMRVAPVALFCYKNYELMVDVARKQSQITHTHKTGVDGAILQAIAIHQTLTLDPKNELDTFKFADDLIEKMEKIETDEEGLGLVDPYPYKTQLKLVRDLISEDGDGPHNEKVVHHLGTEISALYSVPTAIYCFLRAQRPIKDIQTDNPLRRTIQYAYEMSGCNDVRFLSNSSNLPKIGWSDNKIYKLVSWYKKFPCLWRRDIPAYADNVARHYAYRSIHEAMKIQNVTFTDVMIKIRETRRSYINELKKALTAQTAGYTYQPKPNWFNLIHEFLYPYLDQAESAELHTVDCDVEQVEYHGGKTVSRNGVQDIRGAQAAGDPTRRENGLYCEKLHTKQGFCSELRAQRPPVELCLPRNGQVPDWSSADDSNSSHQTMVVPLSDRSTRVSAGEKYSSPQRLRIRIARNTHSLQFSDYWSKNSDGNTLKPGVQFILSSDSLLSERSSSTLVCGKRSDYTCTPVKHFTECGVQWKSSDNGGSSPVSCETSSVGKETRDSAISVEYDEHDIFARTIASYLRAMDIETALKARNQIRKVIDAHRLHKPETQSIRLLRPEISGRSKVQTGHSRIEKSHCDDAITRPNQRNSISRSGRDIQPPKKACGLKSNAKKSSFVIEPIITHYKRKSPTSTSVKPNTTHKNISLGGDADTIGSMAGAIAGAFYGEELIKQEILEHCESSSEFRNLADQLFDLASA